MPSSFGSPPETLMAALQELQSRGLEVVHASSVYETSPVPVSDQPLYYNAVAHVRTELSMQDLLTLLHIIEEEFGRTRVIKDEPRILDLDLLAYHQQIILQPEITVPHPRMHERGFVLVPLQEIAPEWTHPESGDDLQTLIDALPSDQEVRVALKKAA